MSLPASHSMRQVLGTLVLVLLAIQSVWAVEFDTKAIADCHRMINRTVGKTSSYSNQDCFLRCFDEYSNRYDYKLNEGQRCPEAESDAFICQNGYCKVREVPDGQLRLKIISASLSTPINGYVTACLINTTKTIHPPMRDRSACVDCASLIEVDTANPDWDFECSSFHQHMFAGESNLVLELWNNSGYMENQYQSGVVLELPEVDSKQNREWALDAELEGNVVNGTIRTQLRWILAGKK